MPSREQLVKIAIDTLKLLKENNGDNQESKNNLASYLYTADTRLSEYLEKLKEYTKLKNMMKTVLRADNQLKKDDAKLEKAIESNPNTKFSGISYIHILSVAL